MNRAERIAELERELKRLRSSKPMAGQVWQSLGTFYLIIHDGEGELRWLPLDTCRPGCRIHEERIDDKDEVVADNILEYLALHKK